VKIISFARAGPIRLTIRANVPEEATLPSVRAIGMPIADSAVATLRSHVATMPQPAPVANPSTCVMVGLVTLASRPSTTLIFFS
jgi:hypothetical protein